MECGERKNTPLWNCKLPEAKAVAVAEQLSEGSSSKGRASASLRNGQAGCRQRRRASAAMSGVHLLWPRG